MPDMTLPWNGASIFAPTRDEYVGMMKEANRAARQEEAKQRAMWRAVKVIAIAIPVSGAPTNILTEGPNEGYVWNLKLFSATLTGADTGQLYIGSAANSGIAFGAQKNRLIGTFGAATTFPVVTWSSSQVYLKHGEAVYAETSGSFRFNNYYLRAEESSAEREAVIYD